jgi:hypothetical protein
MAKVGLLAVIVSLSFIVTASLLIWYDVIAPDPMRAIIGGVAIGFIFCTFPIWREWLTGERKI